MRAKAKHGFTPWTFANLDQGIGKHTWDQILLHDDGLLGYGGTRTFGVGGQGSGKTTINTKFARLSYYIEGVNKQDFLSSISEMEDVDDWAEDFGKLLHPETTIWRGREFDSWNVLAEQQFKLSYPSEPCRPLCIHIHKGSDLKFFEQNENTGELKEISNLEVKEYSKVAQLYNNLVEGGNNIIYPPIKHFMSTRLKQSINMKRNASQKSSKYLKPDENYLVERDIFLFEIFEYLYRANIDGDKRKWFTAIIDESHDLFRSNSTDIYWHIVDCMVDVLVDTRKHNLSLACMTHGINLIDYRILERASHFLWLKGSKPSGSYSQIDQGLVRGLQTGQGVVESIMDGKVGGFIFDRIPNNMSRLVVQGIVKEAELSKDIEDEFAAITESEQDDFVPPEPQEQKRPVGRPRTDPLRWGKVEPIAI